MNFKKLIASWKTVFRVQDLSMILSIKEQSVRNYLTREKWLQTLKNIWGGIWIITSIWYNPFELGCKLRKKSYISFETVLQKHGIIFQDYSNSIFLASDNTLEKKIDGKNYVYRKLKNSILLNPIGIVHMWEYMIASKERAICDMVYLHRSYHFDNLQNIDTQTLAEIASMYNKRTILEINSLIDVTKRNS